MTPTRPRFPTRSASTPWSGSATPPGQRRARRSRRPSRPATTCSSSRCTTRSTSTATKTRELLTANGITGACSRGLARDADISSEDPTVVARGAALLAESLQLTHDIGGTILTGALYSAFGKAPHPLTSGGRANVVAVLRTSPRRPRHSG